MHRPSQSRETYIVVFHSGDLVCTSADVAGLLGCMHAQKTQSAAGRQEGGLSQSTGAWLSAATTSCRSKLGKQGKGVGFSAGVFGLERRTKVRERDGGEKVQHM